ncbi:hypothetical protein BLNAU_23250 [Blattamonas nauphoetae]|uniref:Uncharacterized protein n=1 Tax=Blattamonas nauphoetae TaxID=2049346 RepID=A0ABQ9WRW5_9EUKA|nr:hypothetical protein BLNAU_23250 [Blattamonas nauphoetae]
MLTISSSRIEVSPWTSAIVISGSALEESGRESSVVISKSLMWNDVGSMRGVVETSSFSSIGGSISVSIVGCSFDSSQILGNDRIGLSLTQSARKNVESVGRLSSSLIGCSFVNMSSIGSSHQSRLRHLDQKMLGCVVSLTSSHLSGSTIRDVNTVWSVLCSNSSFSSLLSSPNTNTDTNEEPSFTLNGSAGVFEDGKSYSFNQNSGTAASSVTFSHCHFTSPKYQSGSRPLTFDNYPGSLTLLSNSFTNTVQTFGAGGAVYINPHLTVPSSIVRVESATSLIVRLDGTEEAYILHAASSGGGMYIALYNSLGSTVSDMSFKDCWTGGKGGGSYVYALCPLSLTDCEFINCKTTNPPTFDSTGGSLRNDLVVDTHNGRMSVHRLFIKSEGQSCGRPPTDSSTEQSTANNVQFADFEIRDVYNLNPTDISISDCYTTTTPNSVGMYARVFDYDTSILTYTRVDHDAFNKMGPYLTEQVEAKLDSVWRRLDVIVKGKVQLESQLYEVRLKETEKSAELTGELQFVNGVGSLLPSSNLNLKFSTAYTITSIVGVVPSSSSESNAIPITAEAWAFNLAATPDFVSFTTRHSSMSDRNNCLSAVQRT